MVNIKNIFGATEEEIKSKKFNIFLGISLGSKYFTEDKIREYILWSLDNTREEVIIVIADKIHAINYEIRSGYNPKRALNVALRKGNEKYVIVKNIINSMSSEKKSLIKILRWEDIENMPHYQTLRTSIYDEFKSNSKFKKFIFDIVKENIRGDMIKFEQGDLEKLSSYVLDELALLLGGLICEEKYYNLHPYPKFTKIHELIFEIQNKDLFPNLSKRSDFKKMVFVELN